MRSVSGFLLVANVGVFLLQALYGPELIAAFALWPLGQWRSEELGTIVGFQPWQLVTSAFLHGGILHLFLNMFALRMFGQDVELELGSRRFLALYFAAVLTAAFVQLAVVSAASTTGDPVPTVGASGGVFGVLLAFGVLFPRRQVLLLIPPMPLPAWLAVTLYGVIELANGVLGTMSGVAHFAHLGGMLGAGVLLLLWHGRAGRQAPPPGW